MHDKEKYGWLRPLQIYLDVKDAAQAIGLMITVWRGPLSSTAATTSTRFGNRVLIVDENLSPNLTSQLAKEGYRIKVFPKGTPDGEIIVYADKNKGIVITNNIKDFNKWGITTFKVGENVKSRSAVGEVVQAVKNVETKAVANPDLVKKGQNVSLAEFKIP